MLYKLLTLITVLLRPSAGCVSRNRYSIIPRAWVTYNIAIRRTRSTHESDILFAFLQPRYQALVVVVTGFEPVTPALSEPYSNQLSYTTIYQDG